MDKKNRYVEGIGIALQAYAAPLRQVILQKFGTEERPTDVSSKRENMQDLQPSDYLTIYSNLTEIHVRHKSSASLET